MFEDLFESIVSVQQASLLTWKEKYRFPFNLMRSGEKIILYGAGPAGRAAYEQLMQTDWVRCIGWIDSRYGTLPDPRVQSPDIIRTADFDRIVILIDEECE